MELNEFAQEFFQEIDTQARAQGQSFDDQFFDAFCGWLAEYGEIDSADRVFYEAAPARPIRIDGYGGDPSESDGVLTLLIADYTRSPAVASLNRKEMESLIARPLRFLQKSLNALWRGQLPENSVERDFANLIHERWPRITKIRIILITNRELRLRVDGVPASNPFEERPIVCSVWDISRLHRFVTSQCREEIDIQLKNDYRCTLPVLPASLKTDEYEAYLTVVPATLLAQIYDRWGPRLLEQNIRVFLQAKGNVNRGIKQTLENDPGMFFAYNNGITATAQSVDVVNLHSGQVLVRLKNLQIVNGGQTTASIHAAYRNKVDLSRVFVQMKLTIVSDPERAAEIVPKISRYANSQNRVNTADFYANHPFHVRIADLSRRLYAPSPNGSTKETKWFYERTHGQYANEKLLLSGAPKKKFERDYPKAQVFTKTDLAKFLNVWALHPDRVSLGAQKNFASFAQDIGKSWRSNPNQFDERYFRELIAKAIIFRRTEQLISEQPWFTGTYRQNLIAYAISRLAQEVLVSAKSVDFQKIWTMQSLSPALEHMLVTIARQVQKQLTSAAQGTRNVTEWVKKPECWQEISRMQVELAPEFVQELIDPPPPPTVQPHSGIDVERWEEVFEYTTYPREAAFLSRQGLPAPLVGQDWAGKDSAILGEIEWLWEEQKVAFVDDEAGTSPLTRELQANGWKVIHVLSFEALEQLVGWLNP